MFFCYCNTVTDRSPGVCFTHTHKASFCIFGQKIRSHRCINLSYNSSAPCQNCWSYISKSCLGNLHSLEFTDIASIQVSKSCLLCFSFLFGLFSLMHLRARILSPPTQTEAEIFLFPTLSLTLFYNQIKFAAFRL
jgi:hypothetical protein